MTRTYAAKRLLEHGALSQKEFTAITGWKVKTAQRVLQHMVKTGQLTIFNPHRLRHGVRLYVLPNYEL